MKIGISFLKLNPAAFAEVTKEGEQLGFESVWLSDHLVFPVDLGDAPYPGANADSPGETVQHTIRHLRLSAGRSAPFRVRPCVPDAGLALRWVRRGGCPRRLDGQRVRRRRDGLQIPRPTPGRDHLAQLDGVLDAAGRGRGDLEITVVGSVRSTDDIRRREDLGVHRVILTPWNRSRTAVADMREFATTIGLG